MRRPGPRENALRQGYKRARCLPATVDLLGSPLSAATDPASGFYSLGVCPSTYTLRASAPGYYPEERLVSLSEASTQDFVLLPIVEPQVVFMPLIIR